MMSGATVSFQDLLRLKAYATQSTFVNQIKKTNLFRSGQHTTHYRGSGIDYAESRGYQIGDEIRHMDWRVTARTGKPHTKLFHPESERSVYFVVDFSPSMYFGTRQRFKTVLAAEWIALTGFALELKGFHHFEGIIFGREKLIETHVQFLKLLKQLANCSEQKIEKRNPLSLEAVIKHLIHRAAKNSIVYLLSDWYDYTNHLIPYLKILQQQHELKLGYVYDPFERELPKEIFSITNNHEWIELHGDALQKSYHKAYQNHYQTLLHGFSECKANWFELETNSRY